MADGRVSQLPVEVAILSDAPIQARVSQLPVEIGILSDVPIQARVSQLPVEVLIDTSIVPPVTGLTRVQAAPKVAGTGTTASCVFSTNPAVGNGIIVYVFVTTTLVFGASACTDNYGNTYSLAVSRIQTVGAPDTGVAIYYCPLIAATGASFTTTFSVGSSVPYAISAVEVSGVGSSPGLVLDQTTSQVFSNVTSWSTGTTAALSDNNVFVAASTSCATNQAALTVESVIPSWTEEYEHLEASKVSEADSRILTTASGTTTSCSWTCSVGGNWSAVIAVFKASAVVTPPAGVEKVMSFLSRPR